MNLILLEPAALGPSGEARLRDDQARHALSVLRVKPGDTVRVGVVDGPVGTGTVVTVEGPEVILACHFEVSTPDRPRIDLLLAIPRPKVLRRLWAQLAALGVARIALTNAEKVERHYFDAHVIEPATFRPLLIEGLQQARDTRLPEVRVEHRLKPFVEDALEAWSPRSTRLVADPTATLRVAQAVADAEGRVPGGRFLIAIGPEGGWSPYEIQLLGRHRFTGVGLGPRTLRTDTACISLLTLINDALH